MKPRTFWPILLVAASSASAWQLVAANTASTGQVSAASTASACQMLDHDHIRAADLAAAMPVFAALDPAMEVGLTPLPGITRVFHAADLLRLARTTGIVLSRTPADVCFERKTGLVGERGSARTATAPAAPAPLAVRRGDRVAVKVVAGGVALKFEAEAQSSGRPGDTVIVLNPENGNRFAARVEDQGKVVVNK